jgi:defect-in-organelle-trafficking protein DotB
MIKEIKMPLPIPPVTVGVFIDEILKFGIDNDVSDFHIISDSKAKVDIHGRFYVIIDRNLTYNEVIAYLGHIYEGGTVETRLNSSQPVDKAHIVKYNGKKYRFRVNAVACQVKGKGGVHITIRAIQEVPPSKDSLNLEDEIWNKFLPEQGIIFVTGPTGSGKSTLLASGIREVLLKENLNKKIVTFESPIEYVYDSFTSDTSIITQTEIPNHLETFEKGVESALRQKPDIILIGESRDKETINAALMAAQTGHLVYTTTHTNGVAETMRRLLAYYEPTERSEKMAALIDSTHMIITQRLEKTTDGKRKPIKEYLHFTREVKNRLYDVESDKVSKELMSILKENGTGMYQGAKKLFEEGLITEDQLRSIKESFNS